LWVFLSQGCVDCLLDNLKMFDSSEEVEVPIHTTLSNDNDPAATTLSAVLSPDLVSDTMKLDVVL
jgi:hypothetical protein